MIEDLILIFAMLIIPLFWLRIVKKETWKRIQKELTPFSKNWKGELFGSIKLFFALLVAFILLSYLLTLFGMNDLDKVSEVIAISMENAPVFILTMIVLVFIEEFFFRGFLVGRIGVVPSSIVFGLAHIGYYSIAEMIGAFSLGLILAYWFNQNKSIIQNYFGHLFYNLFAIALYLIVG